MAINKNFVVKNGIEVNTNLIVADTDSNKVGIGTTVPEYTLHVFEGAGIGVTNITVTGISTNLDELNVGVGGTTLTAISNATLGIGGSVGVGTDAPGYLLEVHSPVSSGQTALFVRGDMRVTGDINIDDISIGDLNVSGISTFVGNILIGTGATVGFGSTAFFKDHAKAIFGDGEDLKVYHDGSNSYISDTGTGGLIVGSNSLTIKNAALNETQAVFTENGAVELYHDNGKRFNTNAIGVEVSGTLQSTGITTLASSGGITTTGGDLYVGGDLFINEDIVLDTNLEILGIATIGSLHVTGISTLGGTVNGPNNNNSVVVGTGLSVHGSATGVAVTLAGAGGITTTGGDFYVGGDLYISEDVVLDTNLNILGIATIGSLNISGTSGINTIDSTVQSTSKDTGSLVLQGGLGVEKQLYVGAGASIGAGLTVAGNLLPDTEDFRDLGSSGAEWKDLYIDGTANIDALIADTAKISDLSANRVVYSSSADGELSDSANLTFDDTTLAVDAIFDSNDTTQSTSATTGSAKFAGGVGIEKQLYVGAGASVGAGLTVAGDILPEADGTRDLGSSGAEFKDLYIDGTANIDALTLTSGSTVTVIRDEDDMSSDSDTSLATQQSIKAYVDSQVTAQDLDFQGDSGGAQSVDLDSQTFTIAGTSNEIETSASGQTLTIGLPNNVTIGGELDVTTLDVSGNADIDGHTELDNVNVAGFSTFVSNVIIGTGATVGFGSTAFFRDDAKAIFGDGEDLEIYHEGSYSIIQETGPGQMFFQSNGTGFEFRKTDGEDIAKLNVDGSVELYYNGTKKFETGPAGTITVGVGTFDGLSLGDDEVAKFGNDNDLQIYHDGSNSYILDSGTGHLVIRGEDIFIANTANNKTAAGFDVDGSVDLYHNGTKKFETGPAGTITVGVGTFDGLSLGDNEKALFGAGNDLQIYHDGSHSYVLDNGEGDLRLASNSITRITKGDSETCAAFNVDGASELYHDNVVKFQTTSSGIIHTGITTFSSTSHIKVPVGTTAQRPSGVAGDFRYNTTTGNFEGYTDSWGAIAGSGGGTETDTSVSSTSATSIYTTAHATNRSVSAIIQITQGTSYQVGRYLVIHDGTTATIVEESAVATGDMLGSFTADINGSNLRILVNMASASSATVTILPTVVTV